MSEINNAQADVVTRVRDVQADRADIVTQLTSASLILCGIASAADLAFDLVPETSEFVAGYLTTIFTASGIALFALNRRCNTMRADERS